MNPFRHPPPLTPSADPWLTSTSNWSAPSAEDEVLSRLEAQAVAAAIAQLPPDQRSVVDLRDVQGYSGPMVAKALGLTVPARKSRLHRARTAVRETLGVPT
ncbi:MULTISPECIES: RNA polymerase sigma factor [Kribbella]|uniref:RNA polymerase sigma factor n=1 Tax=Kribbella TaxID=182639 RepID=UPI002F5D859F